MSAQGEILRRLARIEDRLELLADQVAALRARQGPAGLALPPAPDAAPAPMAEPAVAPASKTPAPDGLAPPAEAALAPVGVLARPSSRRSRRGG